MNLIVAPRAPSIDYILDFGAAHLHNNKGYFLGDMQ